jgi:4-hydroxy-2-oxoheptanedioate aldolase
MPANDTPIARVPQTLRSRVAEGQSLVGSFVNLGALLTTEMMGLAGFDWLVIDLEHGAGSESALIGQLQALAHTGTSAVVRVEALEPARFIHALDAGAAGVLVPRLRSVADARAAVDYSRYSGSRGVARLNRAHRWGSTEWDPEKMDAEILCAVQIETLEALDAVDDIAAVEGVDLLFLGPSDLSHALGLGSPDHPDLMAKAQLVADAARKHGKAAGVLTLTPSQAKSYAELGFKFLGCSSDSGLLAKAARSLAGELAVAVMR